MKSTKIFLTAITMIVFCLAANAQILNVSGTVTDKTTGKPIAGVTVLEKTTKKSTVTDANGKYAISVVKGKTLTFSH
jgi:hypothetical protein